MIFNPTARGERARQFRRELTSLAGDWALKPTAGPGHAIYLAREAVSEGFDTIVAAGGDGTVSEVVHGIATAESGLERVRLGVVPLGTMNVLARELGFPQDLHAAWNILRNAREVQIDLPCVEFGSGNDHQRRYFAQLAGAGLDACAIAAVNWDWKKRIGPLAYLVAGFQAFMAGRPTVHARCGSEPATGELILIGNGRFYGGSVPMFPQANMRDGLLEVRVIPRVTVASILRFGWAWLWDRGFKIKGERFFRVAELELTSNSPVPFEVDGDNAGFLPARFFVMREALRVIVP